MGFWSGLGKGLLGAGGVIAAPFTGGASLATIIPAIGGVASAVASGRAAGRQSEAVLQGANDRSRIAAAQALEDALQGRANLDLRQRQFALAAPGQRAGNSVRGDVLSNVQDAQVMGPVTGTHGRVPTITGGLRPSLLSGNTRQLGADQSRQALLSQMQGDNFDKLPPINIPQPTPLPQANAFDKILGGVGLAGGLLGGLGDSGLFDKYGINSHGYSGPNVPNVPNLPYQPPRRAKLIGPDDDPLGGF